MSLDHFIIIDPDSGTYFGANTAMILDTRKLSEGELETLNEGSDGERGDLASEHGSYIENLILAMATTLTDCINFAETSEDYDTFKIIRAARKMRKLGDGSYSKMVLTGELDFCDYGAGFINFEVFHCYQALENAHYSRIWFRTEDDGDMGAWIPQASKEETIEFNDKFAEGFLKKLEVFPSLEALNKLLLPWGIYVIQE